MSKIIAISGFARSGKDTAFKIMEDYLQLNEGWSFQRVAFADALKSHLYPLVSNKLGIDLYNCSDSEKELIRPLMVEYGKAHRSLDGEYWVKESFKDLDISESSKVVYVVTDLRYENERLLLKKLCKESNATFSHLHLNRIGFKEGNQEELEFTAPLEEKSDISLSWVSMVDYSEQEQEQLKINYAEFFSKEVIR